MSNLEDAASHAVAQVRPLRERLTDVERECVEATGQINTLRERLDTDRTALRDAVAELAHAAQDAGHRLTEGTQAAEPTLTALATASHDAGESASQEMQTEASGLDGAADELTAIDPHVSALADAAAEASRAALQRVGEIEQGLAQAIDAAEQLLGTELAGLLADARRTFERAATELAAAMHDTYPASLTESEHDWETKAAEIQEMADKTFTEMERHTKEVAEYTEGALRALVDEQLNTVTHEAEALRGSLDAAGHELADEKGRLQVAAETLAESLKLTTDGAKIADQKLDEVRGRWGIEGFPC